MELSITDAQTGQAANMALSTDFQGARVLINGVLVHVRLSGGKVTVFRESEGQRVELTPHNQPEL